MRIGAIEFATTEEILKAFNAMSAADTLRLEQFALFRARSMPWLDWRDLVHEAVKRSLDGERRWPLHIPFIQFLRECVRSLAHEEMRRHIERPVVTAAELPVEEPDEALAAVSDDHTGPEGNLAAQQVLNVLLRHFANDRAVLAVVDGHSLSLNPAEVCEKSGITRIEYDSAQKRIRRWVLANQDLR